MRALFPEQWLSIEPSKTLLCFIFLRALIFFVSPPFSCLLYEVHMENERRPSLLVSAAAYVVIYKTTKLHSFDSSVLSYSASLHRERKDLAKEVTNLHAAETVLVFPSPALVYPEMEIT